MRKKLSFILMAITVIFALFALTSFASSDGKNPWSIIDSLNSQIENLKGIISTQNEQLVKKDQIIAEQQAKIDDLHMEKHITLECTFSRSMK